jgi:hypothetical protein
VFSTGWRRWSRWKTALTVRGTCRPVEEEQQKEHKEEEKKKKKKEKEK